MRLRSGITLVLLPLLVILTATNCGTVAAVRPLPRGQSALGVSFGGPVAHVAGMDLPMPYAVARYRYGLTDRSGLCAGAHLLAAGRAVIGVDAGWSGLILAQSGLRPAVSTTAGLVALVKPGDGQALLPQLDLTASYLHSDRFLTYFGSQSLYQLTARPYVILAPFVGEEVRLGSRLSLCAEAKWYAPFEKTSPRNVSYRLPIAGHGGLGLVLGVNYLFGGWYEAE
jgi:hypothetical protein